LRRARCRRRTTTEFLVDGSDLLLEDGPHVLGRVQGQQVREPISRELEVAASERGGRAIELRLARLRIELERLLEVLPGASFELLLIEERKRFAHADQRFRAFPA